MSRFYFKHIGKLSRERLELYWLLGFRRNVENQWFVAAAMRECESGRLLGTRFPIGALPLLALGRTFSRGGLDPEPCRGEVHSAQIYDLSTTRIATSAELDSEHYSFGGRPGGVQRIFEYRTAECRVLIPVVELMRFLFVHNRLLAQAILRPGALNLLIAPQVPSISHVKRIDFTKDMPKQCLTRAFVREFAWLALDPDARRSWDSVATLTADKDHVIFRPPPLKDAVCRFRGVRHGDTWLVQEIFALSGRTLPCSMIEFRHPALVRTVRLNGTPDDDRAKNGLKSSRSGSERCGTSELVIDEGTEGSASSRKLTSVEGIRKHPQFENPTLVKAIPARTKEAMPLARPRETKPQGSGVASGTPRTSRVSAGEPGTRGALPPIEFTSLPSASAAAPGTLEALYNVAAEMRAMAPSLHIACAPVFLKEGRAFSLAGQDRRLALIVVIQRNDHPPVVLLDVERTGVAALALMALRFRDSAASSASVEHAAREMLDGLVDQGGKWSAVVEASLSRHCLCERLPKALCPRQGQGFSTKDWAIRLVDRLGVG
jgi:hypothetical protein